MSIKDEKIRTKLEQLRTERDEALRPAWVRAPKPGGVEFYSGLGRGKLYQAEALGYVKTASLKPPGAVRGVKLFNLKSVLSYVESCANEPANEKSLHRTPAPPTNANQHEKAEHTNSEA